MNHTGHAYIFEGEGSSFVRGQALAFAKGLNCGGANAPCGGCLSCRTFDSGNHPDTIYVTGTKQSGIGVDDVREQILLPMARKPFRYKYKVFIVDKAETLTPAAQNALLKTIEEPAPYGVFLFLAAHVHNFLPTLLSRCALKKLRPPSQAKEDPPALRALAEDVAGRAGGMDILEAFALYRLFEPLGKDALAEALDMLYESFGEKIARAARAGRPPKNSWFSAAAAITQAKKILAQNGNTQLAIELMLLKMRDEAAL